MFGPIRVVPPAAPRPERRPGDRVSELTRAVEALLFVATEPLSVARAGRADRGAARAGRAGAGRARRPLLRGALRGGARAGGGRIRVPRGRATAEACARLLERPPARGLSQAALETLAIIAYLAPVSRPEIARIRGVASDSAVAGPARARPDRGGRARPRRRAARRLPHDHRLRADVRPGGRRGAAGALAVRADRRRPPGAPCSPAPGRRPACRSGLTGSSPPPGSARGAPSSELIREGG